MAEIKVARIKSLFGELKGYLEGLPTDRSGPFIVEMETGNNFNTAIEELSTISETDYSRFKIPGIDGRTSGSLSIRIVKPKMTGIVSRLGEEYGFGQTDHSSTSPSIVIFNKNQSEISLEINYTINDLIADEKNENGKTKLKELKEELGKSDKNWEIIKSTLIWILNYSKELSLKIIPLILQSKL